MLARRVERRDDLFVTHLRKITEVLADGIEHRGRLQTDDAIGFASHEPERLGGRDSRRRHERHRMPRPHGAQRRDHRRAGRDAVVEHDGDASGGLDRRARGAVTLASRAEGLALRRDLPLQIVLGPEPGRLGIEICRAVLVNGSDREFRIERRAQFAHQHDIQVAVQRARDEGAHRHRAARNGEDERMASTVLAETFGEKFSSLRTILEWHVGVPANDGFA